MRRARLVPPDPAAADAGSLVSPVQRETHTVNNEARERAEQVLGYPFKNPNLLKEALTHASIADNRLDSNERMEFLGDAVLDLIICEALYLKFPEYQEGELTKIKSAVVSRRTCAEVSIETGLVDLLIIGKGVGSGVPSFT